jgi:hypothetical protein
MVRNKLMYLDFSQNIDQPKSTTPVVLSRNTTHDLYNELHLTDGF